MGMPTIICSYCEYVGQGDDFDERLLDVQRHEEDDCREKPEENEDEENEN